VEFTGIITDISNNIINGDVSITFSVNEKTHILPEYERLKNIKKLKITAVQYREKRSLDANSYCWKLMSEMAELLRISKEEVYENMLQRYGTNAKDSEGNLITISVPAKVDIKNADIHCAFMGKGYAGDKEFNHYRLIKGSSMYDTKEMSILIDGVVSECKELGIETLPDDQIRHLKAMWGD
jgi:hypothetical protein